MSLKGFGRPADDWGVPYPSDLTDDQWLLVERLLDLGRKRGRKHGDLRTVLNGILFIRHTGAQWRFLPVEFGRWTRCWSQFRRWTANGTWTRSLAELHQEARGGLGRGERLPSLVTIDSSLARGASNGGATFHDQGGRSGWTNGATRVIAVDVTGLPLAARVTAASVTESETVGLLLGDMAAAGQNDRLDVVLVDRGTGARQAQRHSKAFGVEVRRVFHDPPFSSCSADSPFHAAEAGSRRSSARPGRSAPTPNRPDNPHRNSRTEQTPNASTPYAPKNRDTPG